MISIDDFKKIEIRVGLVTGAINQEGSEKLIKLTVNFGMEDVRTIFTAVRSFGYTPEYFLNKKWLFVTNMEPKIMPSFAPDEASKGKGEESQGMILAVDSADKPIFVPIYKKVDVGAKVR